MSNLDIRWHQRLNSFQKAYSQFMEFHHKEVLNKFEEQGFIQAFEYTYELAWNVIKDFYLFQGFADIQGSRDAFKLAFNRGLIGNGEIWMDMIKSRTLSSHTYDENITKEILLKIRTSYQQAFSQLYDALQREYEKHVNNQ